MSSLFLIIFLVIHCSTGFLLDSSTKFPGTGNFALSDRYYIQLMDRLKEQNTKIDHLEQKYATVLQELVIVKDENKNLSHKLDIIKTVQSIPAMINDINLLKATDQARSQDFIALNKDVQTTSQKLHDVSTVLESNLQNVTELHSSMTHIQSKQSQLEVHDISEMKRDIHLLKATNQARNQDVTALYRMATTTSEKLDNVSKLLKSNVQNVTALDSSMTQIKSNQSQISMQLQQTQQTVSNNSRKVMIRSCGAIRNSTTGLIRFPTIKESKGISNISNFISSGRFTCEDDGLYLLMVIIFSSYNGADVHIYKNSNSVQNLELHIPDDHYFSTIPGSLALLLNVGDTIYVKSSNTKFGQVPHNCLSIIKIR